MQRALLILLALLAFSPAASAEKCWMLGCEDSVGYIRIKPSSSGQPLPFSGTVLPKVGDTAFLCAYAYLRVYAIADPIGVEKKESVAGNLLGPNTKVKVLEYISRSKEPEFTDDFVVVRVLKDDSTCPSECQKCGGVVY
ncbi:MAG: hypothetical protein PHX10_07975 [Gallionellaceae bacterium]|nr:hypothetical protein [Gallionellaceae bacterium]